MLVLGLYLVNLAICTYLPAHRGTIGAGEIAEAISDPKRAATFAARVRDLIKENPATDERVSKTIKAI